jgi:hypothetical protein
MVGFLMTVPGGRFDLIATDEAAVNEVTVFGLIGLGVGW